MAELFNKYKELITEYLKKAETPEERIKIENKLSALLEEEKAGTGKLLYEKLDTETKKELRPGWTFSEYLTKILK
jgi:hypothetical protein